MGYEVKQGDIFGRIGTGFGQGLAEQVPKEIERNRLSAGLNELANRKDLTPFQRFAGLSSVPGATPQMIQSGAELLRQEGLRNAYANRNKENRNIDEGQGQGFDSKNIRDVGFANQNNKPRRSISNEEKFQEFDQPQIVETNPLRDEALPATPWSPERRDNEIERILEQRPELTVPEAVNIAADNEKRDLQRPEIERQRDQYLEENRNKLRNEFKKQIETKLQKVGEGVYKDITGENLVNLQRQMEKELRTNPKATIADVADKWSSQALDLAKTKSQIDKFKNRNLLQKLNPFGQKETLNKLKSYQKIFSESGNSEEFFNLLKSDFSLSPQYAASIAYPLSKEISSYADKKIKQSGLGEQAQKSRKYAEDIANIGIKSTDSVLSIVKSIKDKDSLFNEEAFLNELRQNENLNLNPRQQRELAEGVSDLIKSWGDILIFPWGE